MLYLDTSLVVAMLTRELHSDRVDHWLADHLQTEIACSDWVTTEFSAALSAKVRSGSLSEQLRTEALQVYGEFQISSVHRVDVKRRHLEQAARLADQSAAGLRGGDALHAAIAADIEAKLCTLDKRFAQACSMLGIESLLV